MPHPLEHSEASRHLAAGEAESIAEEMKVFGTASRVRVLFALLHSPRTVDELADEVGMASSAVSQQLRVLRQLRFVVGTREGRNMRYRLHDHHVSDLLVAIRHHFEHAERGWGAAEELASQTQATNAPTG